VVPPVRSDGMPLLQDLFHSIRAVSSTRPEQKAVPSTTLKPLLGEFAKASGAQDIRARRTETGALASAAGLSDRKRNISMARKDAPIATGISAASAILDIREAKKIREEEARQEETRKKMFESFDQLFDMIDSYPDKYFPILYPNE